MDRKKVVDVILGAISSSDTVIAVGDSLYHDIDESIRSRVLFLDYDDNPVSVAIGISMYTKDNVYIFVDDFTVVKGLHDMLSAIATGNKNIRIVFLSSGNYKGIDDFRIVTSQMNSVKSLFFNMGFLIHDYIKYIKNNPDGAVNEVSKILLSVRSPLIIIMSVSVVYKGDIKNFKDTVKESISNIRTWFCGDRNGI